MPKDQHRFDVKIEAVTGKQVTIEDGHFIANAEFHREGADLFLSAPDGRTVMIEGYFNQNPPPDIATKDGARLSPDLVQAFLPAQHVGQYAEAGHTASDASPAGKITQLQGDAVVIHADGTKTPATLGMAVMPGDIIQTSAKGAVNLLFTDNTTFAISENARLSIDQYVYNAHDESGSTFFSMLQGVFVYTSGLIGKHDPAAVNIETPVGSIGIRGTVVAGTIAPAGQESKITIVDGAVVVSNTAGSLTLNSSFQTASLTSDHQAPVNNGQISVSSFSQTYSSVSTVANDTFSHLDAYAAHAAATGAPPPPSDTSHTATPPPVAPPAAPDATHSAAPPPPTDATHPAGPTGDATAPAPAPVDTTTAVATAPVETIVAPPPPLSTSSFGALQTAPDLTTTTTSTTTQPAPLAGPSGSGFGDMSSTTTAPSPTGTSTFAAPTTTTVSTTNGTTSTTTTPPPTTTSNTNTNTTPPPPPPSVFFAFSPFYLHGTPANTSDDGVPTFARGLTAPLVVGTIQGANLPADAVISITGDFTGNALIYSGTAPADNTTAVVAGQTIFQYDATTHNLLLVNPWAVLPALNPAGFHFDVAVTSASQPGLSVATAFNVIFSEPGVADPSLNTGMPGGLGAHIIIGDYGGSTNISAGGPVPDTLLDTTGTDLVYGNAGNDTIQSRGGADTLFGGAGIDTISVANGNFHLVDGGLGNDLLVLGTPTYTTAQINIDFTSGTAPVIENIETLNLGKSSAGSGSMGSHIRLDIQDVFDMTEATTNHTLNITAASTASASSSAVDVVMNSAAGSFTLLSTDVLGISPVLHYSGTLVSNNASVTLIITETAAPLAAGGIVVSQV